MKQIVGVFLSCELEKSYVITLAKILLNDENLNAWTFARDYFSLAIRVKSMWIRLLSESTLDEKLRSISEI